MKLVTHMLHLWKQDVAQEMFKIPKHCSAFLHTTTHCCLFLAFKKHLISSSMLSEAYLCRIPYHDRLNAKHCSKPEETVHEMRSLNGVTYTSTEETQGTNLFWRCRSVGKLIFSVCSKESRDSRRQKDSLTQATPKPVYEKQTSSAVEICMESAASRDTYLVPPSCKSICKNYNDLHIAGDQVLPMSSVKADFTYDSGIGPFLESSEIPPPVESIVMPHAEVPHKPTQGYSSCWRVGSMQHQQPLSNSILNDYLEEKVVELYKQYIMDGMGNNASPTQILASEFIMTNVDQITMKLSQDKNMKTTKAKDMVINCLLRLASGKVSTEISTPSLQFSDFSTVTK
ncbi:TLR adapter interacting with SLC15A4 on the lysosome [Hemicordylus capensis]|uniref:TLR adapter interacting with SLC15A4 on the lysosome n=1 Tax=Hemicordylus capensis TaxID=884348 RepID=UPI0023028576|nr:TLR adapter interacting with SLC15A4 on the lysosome [Hemicordylus capensis]